MDLHPNHQRVVDALTANPAPLIGWAAERLISLGAKGEWDMDDNFETTESLAGLAGRYGLPEAGDQGDAALRFWGEAAQALGLPSDLDDDDTIGATS